MLKRFKIVSLSAIAVIMIVGCGKSSTSNDQNVEQTQVLPKVSQSLKSFFKTRSSGDEVKTNETINKAGSEIETVETPNELVKNCQNGGTTSILNDFNRTAIMATIQSGDAYVFHVTSTFTDCIEEGATTNGTIKFSMEMNQSKSIMTAKFLTDMVIQESEGNTTIKKDSYFSYEDIDEDSTTSIETKSMEAISAKHSYKSENLKTHETDNKDGSTTSYDISGKETIDGLMLVVDETYDASQTPMVTDADGNLQKGGKARYTNDQNHTIMIEAIDVNKVQISVDEDGDGKADKQETVLL